MHRVTTMRRVPSHAALAAPRLAFGLLCSCSAVALSHPASAQSVAIDNGACPANPAAVVVNGGADGLSISGAANCPAGTAPAARVDDDGGIAIGNDRANPTISAGGGNSIAIGNGARGGAGQSSNTVAIGTGAQAISEGSVAIGQGAITGSLTDPTRIRQVAIGHNAAATAQNSTAIGDTAIANGPQATAIGSAASAGTNATATGRSAVAGNSAVAYGVNANAGLRGTALGQGAGAAAVDSTAIGSFAAATVANSVALGRQSVASRGAQTGYTGYGLIAPQSSVGEVSIGTAGGQRQLTGVSAGSAQTDAVNVSQLQAIDAQADLLGSNVASALGGGAGYNSATGALTPPNYSVQGGSQATVAGALTALDAQLTANTGDIATNTAGIATNAGDIADLQAAIGTGSIGLVQQAAAGADLTVGAATDGAAVTFSGTGGDRRLTGVSAGAISSTSGEAINGAQVFAGNSSVAAALGGGASVNADGTLAAPSYVIQGTARGDVGSALTALDDQVTLNSNGIAALTNSIGNGTLGLVQQATPGAPVTVAAATGGATVSFAGTAGNRTLTGVANGAATTGSTDAINGGQLSTTAQSVAVALGGGSSVNADGTVSAPSYAVQGGVQTSVGGAIAALDTQVTSNNVAIAGLRGDVADLGDAIASGSVGLVQQAGAESPLTVGAATDGDTVSFAGAAGDRRLTGLAAGSVSATSTDAVNGAQLNATNLAIQNVADLVTQQGGAFASNNAGGAAVPQASGAEASAGGNGAVASGARASAVGNNASATGTRSTAIGYDARATGNNSVAIGAGSSDDGEEDVVSVGSAASQRRVVNVDAGINATDAVNVGQLNSAMGQTLLAANAYTDARFAEMAFDIGEIRRDGRAATASAMALAGIPQSFERGMGMVGMGVGTWQGESAVALGISKATDNGRVVFKAGATYSTRGQGGANGGVGLAF